jgi:hypothetical protein
MPQNYSEAEMAAHLTQARCKRFDMQTAPGTGDKEMTVFWEVSHNKVSEAVAFLDKYAVADNYTASPNVATQLLTDPVVENEPYAGKWRVVRNWFDPQISGKVFQTRRFGWLTTLLGTGGAIDWSEARIVSGRDHLVFATPVTGETDDYLVLEWRNIKPGSGPTLAKELVTLGTTAQNWTPLGNTSTYGSGGWRLLPVSHQTAQDGSSVLTAAFVKLGVTETAYGNIGSEVETETITERVTEDQMQARVEELKEESNVSDVQPSRGGDGVCQIRYTLRKVGSGSFEYSVKRGDQLTEYHLVAWGQSDLDDLTSWSPTGTSFGTGAALVRSASGVVKDTASGKYSYRMMMSGEVPSFFEYQVLREAGVNNGPSDIEYHKVAWAQPVSGTTLQGLDYLPAGVSAANAVRTVGSVSRDPVTGRYSYHVVVRDKGSDVSTNPDAPNTSYRFKFEKRTMWSVANMMYWDQTRIVTYVTQVCQFASFAAAEAWISALSAGDWYFGLDGSPTSIPDLVTTDTPMPRMIGKNKWIASRQQVTNDSHWYPYEPE